jgi:hypothetical protein
MKTSPQPHPYLIRFEYDYYCQGYEKATDTVLVYAYSYEQACNYVGTDSRFESPRNFENLTLGVIPRIEIN